MPISVVDMCKKLSKNVFGGETELFKTQAQEVKALGGGRWRWTRHQSTKQTDIEFAMNQVDFEYCSSMMNQIDLDNILPKFNVCTWTSFGPDTFIFAL